LQVNENVVEVVAAPGPAVGAPAAVTIRQDGSGLEIVNQATTAAGDTKADVGIFRFPGRSELEVGGTVPLGGAEVVREAAVDNPTLFFARTLRAALEARGIAVTGEAVDIDDLPDAGREGRAGLASQPAPRILLRHLSPPLSEIAKRLMKVSQNLYAETFLRALSLTPGPATVAASQKVEEEVLASWGVAPGNYALADGSGLSRHNLVSADTIVKILRAMATDPADAQAFEATLPIAGKDGTISSRMKATRAENNVKAKTGTLMRVRALSGYMTTADGERLVFSIIAIHFTVPTRTVDGAVDAALERLANFTRRAN
jgi:D-alanyl-D-alanine carboxypeptidase/D-alanyl-D-alanine-endopeptidase (penicillin-binding protein 4)